MVKETFETRTTNNPPLSSIPTISTFNEFRPPSQPTVHALAALVMRLPRENRDLMYTLTELIKAATNGNTNGSHGTKTPFENLLPVFCAILGMTPDLLRVLCESEDVWRIPSTPVEPPTQSDAGVEEKLGTSQPSLTPVAVQSAPQREPPQTHTRSDDTPPSPHVEPKQRGKGGPSRPMTPPGHQGPIHDLMDTQGIEGADTEGSLPPAPTNFFAREGVIDELLDLVTRLASVALFGPVGIGKSAVALTLLHHDRVRATFGQHRYFLLCDNIANSLTDFLESLSDAININRTMDLTQFRSHLNASPPLILLLDGVDSLLDPLATEAENIHATIKEIGSYQHVCLLITSRMYSETPGFRSIKLSTLSEDGARDTFYNLCHMDRSPVVNNLIARLDFHPLSIDLLARAVDQNGWDESRLLREWNDGETRMIKTDDRRSLEAAIESALAFPTIQRLGTTAYEVLEAIAAFPGGVEENRIKRAFPHIRGVVEAINILSEFYLLEREGGYIKLLSPLRLHFMQHALTMIHARDREGHHGRPNDEEEIFYRCNGGRGGPFQDFNNGRGSNTL